MSILGNNLLAQYYAQNQFTIPTDGLIFWHPLNALPDIVPTGQSVVYAEELTASRITEIDGRKCIDLTNGSSSTYSITTLNKLDMPSNSPVTLSIWIYVIAPYISRSVLELQRHPYYSRTLSCPYVNGQGYYAMCSCNNDINANSAAGSVPTGKWVHVCGAVDSSYNSSVFINGSLAAHEDATETSRKNDFEQYATIGCYGRSGQSTYAWMNGYVASARIYNRVLEAKEINALAHEH